MRVSACITILLLWLQPGLAQEGKQLPKVPEGVNLPESTELPKISAPKDEAMPQPPPRGASVKRRPAGMPDVNGKVQTKSSAEPWVVYSDRYQNTTYREPGGTGKLGNLSLMDRCYVIGEKDGYLELAKYDPSILGGKFFPRRIMDRKKAIYYGWVDRNKLLFSNNALIDSSGTEPQRYLTILNSPKGISDCAKYFKKDSIKAWVSPSTTAPVRGYLTLQQYVYVYKLSPDGQFCLAGKTPQFITDGVNESVLGWVPSALLQPWGGRLYIDVRSRSNADLPFYYLQDGQVKNKIDQSIGLVWKDMEAHGQIAPWASQLPVKAKIQQNGHTFLKTELPLNLFDKSKRAVYGIEGNKITYTDFTHLSRASKTYNVVFVIEGNKRMNGIFPYLSNMLQTTQASFNDLLPDGQVNYGIVVYTNMEAESCKIRQRITEVVPLTNNHEKCAEYMLSLFSRPLSCDIKDNGVAAMYPGLYQAANLFKGHEDENNLIILIGAVGNEQNEATGNLIGRLSDVNAKILSFQARNIYFSTANDFVLQSQEIIAKSATQLAINKRQKLVLIKDIVETQSFKGADSLKNVFFLNYPKGSMVQGALMFPGKGKTMPIRQLQLGIDTLLKQIGNDNRATVSAIDHKINDAAFQNDPLNPLIQEEMPSDGKNVLAQGAKCFTQGNWIYSKTVATTVEDKMYKLVLNSDQYNEVLQLMQRINGQAYKLEKRSTRKRIYMDLVKQIEDVQSDTKRTLDPDKMRISDALALLLDCPVQDKSLQEYSVIDLKSEKKLDKNKFNTMIKYLQDVTQKMIDNGDQNKFLSGGMSYYILTPEELP